MSTGKSSNNGKDPNGVPSQAEFGQLTAYLAQNGYTPAQIFSAVGVTPNSRSRSEITDQLIYYMANNL